MISIPTAAVSIVSRASDLVPVITAAPFGRLESGDTCDVISYLDAIVVLQCPEDSGGCTSYGAFYGCDAYFVTTCYDYQHNTCTSVGIEGDTWCCPEDFPNCVTMTQTDGLQHFECYSWLEGGFEVLSASDLDLFQSSFYTEWVATGAVTHTVTVTQTAQAEANCTPVGAVVGGTVGGVAGLLGFVAAAVYFLRSRKRRHAPPSDEQITPSVAQLPASPVPTWSRASYAGGPPVSSWHSPSQHGSDPSKAVPVSDTQGSMNDRIYEAPGN